jgi:hypothetical protein
MFVRNIHARRVECMFGEIAACLPADIDARKDEGVLVNIASVRRGAWMLARDGGMFIGVRECSTIIRDIRRDAVVFGHSNAWSFASRHVRLHADIFVNEQ